MSQSIMNEIYKLVWYLNRQICYDGIQLKKWQKCEDLDSQLQFIRDAIPCKINEATKNQDYEALEKQVQKYENEIRKHIRMEQQIKLYAESLQQKLEEQQNLEECLINTKQLVNSLTKENSQLNEQVRKLQSDIFQLKNRILELNERRPSSQQSPTQEKIKYIDGSTKNNYRYQTIDSATNRPKIHPKNIVDDYNRQHAEVKTQISNTIDSSILKMLQHKREQYKESYKSSRDSSFIEKTDSKSLKQNQQRKISKDIVYQQNKTLDYVKFELKSNKEYCKALLNTHDQIKSKNNSRQENRQKSNSEHIPNQNIELQKYQKGTKINKEVIQSLNYQKYLDNNF